MTATGVPVLSILATDLGGWEVNITATHPRLNSAALHAAVLPIVAALNRAIWASLSSDEGDEDLPRAH